MYHRVRPLGARSRCTIFAPCLLLALSGRAVAASMPSRSLPINERNWGSITAPVYGTSETGPYAGAELFAGPMRLDGNYFHGVLPNGRVVRPAGVSTQIGMNPLGAALTPDGRYLITTNDDERNGGMASLINPMNIGGYSMSVVDTSSMTVVSTIKSGPVFVGLQITGSGPYTVWASGGPSNSIKLFSVSSSGMISVGSPASIAIHPILPGAVGYVSNYVPGPALNTADANGNKPPVPTGFDRVKGAQITFPSGSALSPDQRYLYVACNGDNSLAVVDTHTLTVVKQIPVGFFPYGVSVNSDGRSIAVSNWGVTAYRFRYPTYDSATSTLTRLTAVGSNQPDGFYVPPTSTSGTNPETSSVSFIDVPGGNGSMARLVRSVYQGKPLDAVNQVGDTHPSATAVVRRRGLDYLYVTKANDDSLGVMSLTFGYRLPDINLAPIPMRFPTGQNIHGAYPNAIVASPDGLRLYVAEAGTDTVAVLNINNPLRPRLIGRIPTGWYPTGVVISADGRTLYVINARGVGEDINPNTVSGSGAPPTGIESFSDSNYIFGSVQKVNLATVSLNNTAALRNNFAINFPDDTSVVPAGGGPSQKIKHVFFILHENKTFDSMLGSLSNHFGPFASTDFNKPDGSPTANRQFTGVSLNTQSLARSFTTAVNYYSDSEESDAGHQFCASGTATDYTEKTLLVKSGRGLLVNKNFEPEDYPENGYIFNNAARHGVSFKDYGALIRIDGTDTGASTPTELNDPFSGLLGSPKLQSDHFSVTQPLVDEGDVTSPTRGLGQSYFLALPILAVLGGTNHDGEARLDRNYPGYNFNISDQRRALEFNADFDRMVAAGTLPQYLYIYQPNDHTGGAQAPNRVSVGTSPLQQVADGDVGLGMVVQHIMKSPVYYDPATGEGSAIFVTYDDAQSTLDHIHQHRTPLIVISPYAKPGFVAKRHYDSASIVKTEELLLGLPPNNLGDLLATDLRDCFQPVCNGITADAIPFTHSDRFETSVEGERVWALVSRLNTSAPDQDSSRLGVLTRLSLRADELHRAAQKAGRLKSAAYRAQQDALYHLALVTVEAPAAHDSDD